MSTPPVPRRLELRIDSRLSDVQLAARAVHGLCREAGCSERDARRVELATVEALNNVIRHAYRSEPGHPVVLLFVHQGAEIHLELSDAGSPMRGPLEPRFEFDPADTANLPEGGMGLHLIHSVMDRVEYRTASGRNTLSMTKRLAA